MVEDHVEGELGAGGGPDPEHDEPHLHGVIGVGEGGVGQFGDVGPEIAAPSSW